MNPFSAPGAALAALIATALIPSPAPADDLSRARPQTPEHLWATTCGYCHAGPMRAPELRGRKLPEAMIVSFARNGAAGMPPFHPSAISDGDLRNLARWISRQPAPAPASAAAGNP